MNAPESSLANKRNAVRKPFRGRGKVTVNAKQVSFQSIDIGVGGICLLMPDQLNLGDVYYIEVSAFINGRKMDITAKGKACYCICGSDGFKIGLQFISLDEASEKTISLYMK
jgi:hypothetical protein